MVKTEYNIHQKITIIPLKTQGTIEEIRINGHDTFYTVRYWAEGEVDYVECKESEIAKPEDAAGNTLGFDRKPDNDRRIPA